MLPVRHYCAPLFMPYEEGRRSVVLRYLWKCYYEFVLNYGFHNGDAHIIISARLNPGADHVSGCVCMCVSVCLSAATLALLDLSFLCTSMTVCSRTFCGCSDSQFLKKQFLTAVFY